MKIGKNYIEKIRIKLDKELQMGDDYKDLLDIYVLLVLVRGAFCTNKDVHNAWSVWQNKTQPNHRSLIHFERLKKEVQDLDTKYRDAIIKVDKLNK